MKVEMNPLQTSRYLFVFTLAMLAMAQQPAPLSPAPKPTPAPAPGPSAALTPPTVPPDTVIITVGTEKLTRAQFEELLAALPENVRAQATGPGRGKRQLAEQLAEVLAIAQEARKRKLDQNPAIQQIIALQVDQVLAGVLARQISTDNKPDEAAMHAYFDQHKAEFERVKASHILIRFKGSSAPARPGQKDLTDEEALAKAQDIRKKLTDGGDFAATAKAESDDVGSGAKGGSLGTFGHGQMVPPFEQAAFSLPLNQISEPVKSQFGYHIIKVEERTSKTFDEAKPDLEKQLGPQMAREALDNIRKQAQISIDDGYFGK
jgi:peptidyl-prolyl cis-trans isomerase C